MRDDKHFVRVQGSAINKPIIHIFSSAGKELATVKVNDFVVSYLDVVKISAAHWAVMEKSGWGKLFSGVVNDVVYYQSTQESNL